MNRPKKKLFKKLVEIQEGRRTMGQNKRVTNKVLIAFNKWYKDWMK